MGVCRSFFCTAIAIRQLNCLSRFDLAAAHRGRFVKLPNLVEARPRWGAMLVSQRWPRPPSQTFHDCWPARKPILADQEHFGGEEP